MTSVVTLATELRKHRAVGRDGVGQVDGTEFLQDGGGLGTGETQEHTTVGDVQNRGELWLVSSLETGDNGLCAGCGSDHQPLVRARPGHEIAGLVPCRPPEGTLQGERPSGSEPTF